MFEGTEHYNKYPQNGILHYRCTFTSEFPNIPVSCSPLTRETVYKSCDRITNCFLKVDIETDNLRL